MKYFGQTIQKVSDRWGKGSTYKTSKKIYNAFNEYGWDGFNHFIIAENLTQEEANTLEVKLIKAYNTQEEGYNITMGGSGVMGGRKHSDESRIKIKEARKKQTFSEESQIKKASTMYGFNFKGLIAIDKLGNEVHYNTVRSFCEKNNADSRHVNKCLNGIRKTHKGFKFKFA